MRTADEIRGGSALARELGITQGLASRHLRAGRPPEQLRAQYANGPTVKSGAQKERKRLEKLTAEKKRVAGLAGLAGLAVAKATAAIATDYIPPRGRRALVTSGNSNRSASAPASAPAVVTDMPELDDPLPIPVGSDEGEAAAQEGYYRARERKESASADERELIVAQKKQLLVYRSHVDIWVKGMILKARDVLLRIGPDLQDRLAMEVVPAKCGKLVTEEVHIALKMLSEWRG